MRERYQDVDGRPDLGISGRGAHPAWHRDTRVKRLTDPRSFGTRYSDAPLVPGGYPLLDELHLSRYTQLFLWFRLSVHTVWMVFAGTILR